MPLVFLRRPRSTGVLFWYRIFFCLVSIRRRCIIATKEIKREGGQGKRTGHRSAAQEERADAVREFAIEVARLAANTRCRNVVLLDVRDVSPVTDYMIVATGTSPRQMRTVVDESEELGGPKGFTPIARSGYEGESWILLDFVDVVIHVQSDDARVYYDLDNLWGDARRVDWQAGMPQPQVAGATA